MRIEFYKYQGTGNDFVILDNRNGMYSFLTKAQVAFLCNRRFGIGADGLMLLQLKEGYDFEMIYYNADGGESSMCGNGGRCLAAFAGKLGLIAGKASFLAVDGVHEAVLKNDGTVELKMQDVTQLERTPDHCILNTGSPHYVKWITELEKMNVAEEGRKIRYDEKFAQEGINVNFAQLQTAGIHVRTYERGVEEETLSCGTGVTAVALAAAKTTGTQQTTVTTPGGILTVKYERTGDAHFTNVWLCGPAEFVFQGMIEL